MLWWTRKPWNTWTDPSSIRVGIETASALLHSESTLSMLSSRSISSATRRSWTRAISHGSSVRCERVGASAVVKERS